MFYFQVIMASPQNKSFKAILALYVKKTEKDMSQWFMKKKSLSIVLFVILDTPKKQDLNKAHR